MENDDELQKELKDWSPGFPRKEDIPAPHGYFEKLPGRLISRWNLDIPKAASRTMIWLRMTAAAAMITGICLGIVWLTHNSTNNLTAMKISNEDAYQYILENLEEFEPILLEEATSTETIKTKAPESDAIEQYLLEEMDGGDMESIF